MPARVLAIIDDYQPSMHLAGRTAPLDPDVSAAYPTDERSTTQ